MSAKPIIIDCDPGKDDAIALFLALACPQQLNILGITTVSGNVPLALTYRNARLICEIAQCSEIPVFAGAKLPLKRALVTAENVHGSSGLEGIEIHQPKAAKLKQNAHDFICKTLAASADNEITLVATGPLTNIALMINKAPQLVGKIKEIVLMGGAFREGGNLSPSAEFNMAVDPHAAEIVFNCKRPLTVMGLDVTHQVRANKARRENIRKIKNKVAQSTANLLDYSHMGVNNRYAELGAPVHDPCTIAYLLEPELFRGVECNLSVETESPLTMGHTAVDYWGVTGKAKNITWMESVNADGFFALLTESLNRFN